ncbi:MAG TPA: hypothetical protein VKY40_02620 [Halanaerobiales bacterium]|nr:hypothetical protein [Halanaerobiales bacterium]
MNKASIMDAVDRLSSALNKVEDFNVSGIKLSERVLDNRIITLEGYLRFLEKEGIPKIKNIRMNLNQEEE